MSYRTVGENKVPCHTLVVCPGSGPYVLCDISGSTSDLEIVRLLRGFQGEPYFFHSSSYFPNNS
jgi:hypothetical protein